nr:hypothetical protein [Tanacetum cinerariifolium]
MKIKKKRELKERHSGMISLSPSRNRLESRISLRLPFQVFFGRLQRLSPNTVGRVRRRKDGFPHRLRGVLLYKNALRPQERWRHVPAAGGQSLPQPNWSEHKVHVDDLVVKSHTEAEMLRDFGDTFRTLRKINMKLNLKKCTFEAVEGMFLGYMVTPERIRPCPDKTATVPMDNQRAKRLRRYFQAHPIAVVTDQHIKHIMSRPDVARRLQKWSVMLGEHNITYRPRTSVKGQVLADFLAEVPDESSPAASVVGTQQEQWTLFMDGSSCVDGSGARLILISPEGTEFTCALRFQFAASNNEAEYEALITGLRIAAQMGVQNVYVSVDSKLVANQVLGTYVAKEENMIKYLKMVKSLVLVEILKEKSIQEKEVTTVVEEDGPTWMTPIIEYLKEGTLPSDRKEARKLRIKARQYELMEGVLYRRSFLAPWLRCVGPLQAKYFIREIHEGSCSMHAGPRLVWGIDIVGPFSKGPGKVKFLIVDVDYFTKWIEAKAVATITGSQVKKFVWDNIACHFGLPGEIVLDNGKQFSDNPCKDWCDKLNITQRFASVKHPQSNGLVERANWSLGEGIKARLAFSLTYGTEAVIPVEIGMLTYRTAAVDVIQVKNNKGNARVRGVIFMPGDSVYCSNDASHAVDGGKLGPK